MICIAETDADRAACMHLRWQVFVLEQGVSEADERDDKDAAAVHLLAWSSGAPVGTARLRIENGIGKIERVCVAPEARGKGVGADLMRFAMEHFKSNPQVARVKLGAQVQVVEFYVALGFNPVGGIYREAGIDHQDMMLVLRK